MFVETKVHAEPRGRAAVAYGTSQKSFFFFFFLEFSRNRRGQAAAVDDDLSSS